MLSTHNGQQCVRLATALLFQGCNNESRPLNPALDYWGLLDLVQPTNSYALMDMAGSRLLYSIVHRSHRFPGWST